VIKKTLLCLLLCSLFFTTAAASAEQPLFGPTKYEVIERYGKMNRYQAAFTVKEGLYLIKLQNGDQPRERPDILGFSVNGETLLREGAYGHDFFACVVALRKENTFELVIKDVRPTGFKRPIPTPRNVFVTVLPLSLKLSRGVFGLHAWEDLSAYADMVQKIKSPGSATLAVAAANQSNDTAVRTEAIRTLSDRKDPAALDLFLYLYRDYSDKPDVRGEAALALGGLGDKRLVPALMKGLLDPEEKIRMGSARALSFYKEEDTKEPLVSALASMDSMRRIPIVSTLASVGWRPVGTLMELAGSSDPGVADLGIELLTGSSDTRVVDYLLTSLESVGQRDVRLIISALGASKDKRAIGPLSLLAENPVRRRGAEGEIGAALAALGDPKSADLIVAMIKQAGSRETYMKLIDAYKVLTGKEYRPEPGVK